MLTPQARQVLTRIRDMYTNDPQSWTQGAFARTKDRIPTDPDAKDACSFCLSGAIFHHTPTLTPEGDWYLNNLRVRMNALDTIINRIGLIASWNDRPYRTVQDVINLIDVILKENE